MKLQWWFIARAAGICVGGKLTSTVSRSCANSCCACARVTCFPFIRLCCTWEVAERKGENEPTRARLQEVQRFLVGGDLRLKKGNATMGQLQIRTTLAV